MEETIIMGETTKAVHVFERAGLGKAPFNCVGHTVELFTIPGTGIIKAGASCDYCGTAIAHTFWILSSDERKFKVGSECVRKTGDLHLTKQVKRVKKEAQAKKLAETRKAQREAERLAREKEAAARSIAFLAARPALAEAFEFADKDPVLASMKDALSRWGSLTENQVKYAVKLGTQIRESATEVPAEVKEGKREIVGTVLTVKYTEYMGHNQARMLVKTVDGEKIYGSVPQAIEDAVFVGHTVASLREVLVGKKVKFTATVLRSSDDPFFGFFKRPTKGEVIG